MPDWSYVPLFRPLLFRLPAERARAITLGLIGALARRPGGAALFAAIGDMDTPAALCRNVAGLAMPTPIGLGAGLDLSGYAAPALARLEIGHLELGPITLAPLLADRPIERRVADEAIVYPAPPANPGLDVLLRNLTSARRASIPVGVRLAHRPGASAAEAAEERRHLLAALAPHVDFFTIDSAAPAVGAWSATEWAAHLAIVLRAAAQRPCFLCLAPDLSPANADLILAPALAHGVAGVIVSGGIACGADARLVGAPTRAIARGFVQALRERHGEQLVIIAGGGIQQPADALALLAAGANLVQLHSGLIYNGPGLPKRINEALQYERRSTKYEHFSSPEIALASYPGTPASALRTSSFVLRTPPWFAYAVLGLGMIVSGTLAWFVAAYRVILPYDEYFVRLSRADLLAANARLLDFMAHDRVTLAGTMIAVGILYLGLTWGGIARGHRWAWTTVVASTTFGFLSFFLFLGFGYFDPLHALISLILLPFSLIGALWGRPRGDSDHGSPTAGLRNTRAWRLGLVGQLCFVMLGLGLVVGGLAITATGITQVFVATDLAYLTTESPLLRAISPRLVPLIAHDRAGFGGTLTSNGIAVLLIGLWGIRPGARWLWWTLLLAGIPGLGGAIGVHIAVGYTALFHLAPVWLAAFLYIVGLALTYQACVEKG